MSWLWLLERVQYIATLHNSCKLLWTSLEKKLAQPASKFLFTPNEQCSLKAVVTLNGDEITEADISVESPFKQFYRCGIAKAVSYKLQQLIGCGSTLQAAKLCIQQACEVGCQSEPARTLETLDRIFACLKSRAGPRGAAAEEIR
uniref:Ski_Sno domain-containing protein n=1 Tax=Macrostomum lignano TaxID=282301 RepID=A0A1I8JPB9_9PLAT